MRFRSVLAGFAMGRRGQIVRLRWRDVDLDVGAIEWGVEEAARKSRAARRVLPAVKPLRTLLKRAYLEQGKPARDELVCSPRKHTRRGVMSTGRLAARAAKRWEKAKRRPIGLHECRHTAATSLDAAGVTPQVASVPMGHATPDLQPGAAPDYAQPLHPHAARRHGAGLERGEREAGGRDVGHLHVVRGD